MGPMEILDWVYRFLILGVMGWVIWVQKDSVKTFKSKNEEIERSGNLAIENQASAMGMLKAERERRIEVETRAEKLELGLSTAVEAAKNTNREEFEKQLTLLTKRVEELMAKQSAIIASSLPPTPTSVPVTAFDKFLIDNRNTSILEAIGNVSERVNEDSHWLTNMTSIVGRPALTLNQQLIKDSLLGLGINPLTVGTVNEKPKAP